MSPSGFGAPSTSLNTALHHGVKHNTDVLLDELPKKGAQIAKKNKEGKTAFHLACAKNLKMVEYLYEYKDQEMNVIT